MAMPAGKIRQRAWKPKNRTGCKTCKIRKVKCDEAKPHCKRCTSTGRTCDGYDPNFRPASGSPPHSQGSREVTRSHSPVPLVPALHFNTAQERSSFEFFATHAVSSLRGFVDSPFWQREILQAAHQHESIQHCIIALGAMHRRYFEGNSSHINRSALKDEYLQFALQQSNRAIQGLLKASRPGDGMAGVGKVTLLTCSILFSSLACLQGHQREAIQHLRSGIRILHELDREEADRAERHPIDVDSLRLIVVGLDSQARSIMTTEESQQWEPTPRNKEWTVSQDPELDIATLIALQGYFQTLVNHVIAFLHLTVDRPLEEKEDAICEYQKLVARFKHGTKQLQQLCAKASSSSNDYTQSLLSLQLLQSQTEHFFNRIRVEVEAKFHFTLETFLPPFDAPAHFAKILDLATQLLEYSPSSAPVFTTTAGPLSSLWTVASRAPSSCFDLRKRAAGLMLKYPRREGFWDSILAGQIAQEVLRLEQETTLEELGLLSVPVQDLIIPPDLRIAVVGLKYDEEDDRKAMVEYKSLRDMKLGLPGRAQCLNW